MTCRNEFGKLAEQHKLTGTGAEIGVQYGHFSLKITEFYTGKLLCIDIWQGESVYREAKTRLSDASKFQLYRGKSLEIAPLIPDNSLDFIYIDADHHYNAVKADLAAWVPKVRPGGIIAGHDYTVYDDIEVIPAVDDWCTETGYKIQVTNSKEDYGYPKGEPGHPFPTWWTIKK